MAFRHELIENSRNWKRLEFAVYCPFLIHNSKEMFIAENMKCLRGYRICGEIFQDRLTLHQMDGPLLMNGKKQNQTTESCLMEPRRNEREQKRFAGYMAV